MREALWWRCDFSMHENEGLRLRTFWLYDLRTLWPPSSTVQEVTNISTNINSALPFSGICWPPESTENFVSELKWKRVPQHRLLFWSSPIWHQINKVQYFLFFTVTIRKPACLWQSAKSYSILDELYRAAYRPSGRPVIHQPKCSRVTCAVHKNNYIYSTSCPFCSPEKCGSWGWWRATLCIWEREETLLPWHATVFS